MRSARGRAGATSSATARHSVLKLEMSGVGSWGGHSAATCAATMRAVSSSRPGARLDLDIGAEAQFSEMADGGRKKSGCVRPRNWPRTSRRRRGLPGRPSQTRPPLPPAIGRPVEVVVMHQDGPAVAGQLGIEFDPAGAERIGAAEGHRACSRGRSRRRRGARSRAEWLGDWSVMVNSSCWRR